MTAHCKLVGLVGIIIQLSLGFLSFSVLIVKRCREKPKRPWRIWMLDTSKQVISQLFAHFINLTISIALSYEEEDSDPCLWYFVTNIFDNTVGVFTCIMLLRLIEKFLKKKGKKQYISGNYHRKQILIIPKQEISKQIQLSQSKGGEGSNKTDNNGSLKVEIEMQPKMNILNILSNGHEFKAQDTTNHEPMLDRNFPGQSVQPVESQQLKTQLIIDYKAWLVQLLIWNAIVSIAKSALFGIQFAMRWPLMTGANWAFGWLQVSPIAELMVVIVMVPVIMNGLAFWVQDNFLMKKAAQEESENLLEESQMAVENGQETIHRQSANNENIG